eukprot:TRINITY_DN2457_c0_g2_i11.p1 TRINITY_DN2457_c0_g2~~TRINITY_DN2457_c0_g2_i11.p1  ORF type:complete len:535 (-),score=46.40 TRINITY_DN2457_c0_g2_i11:291-1895(-)
MRKRMATDFQDREQFEKNIYWIKIPSQLFEDLGDLNYNLQLRDAPGYTENIDKKKWLSDELDSNSVGIHLFRLDQTSSIVLRALDNPYMIVAMNFVDKFIGEERKKIRQSKAEDTVISEAEMTLRLQQEINSLRTQWTHNGRSPFFISVQNLGAVCFLSKLISNLTPDGATTQKNANDYLDFGDERELTEGDGLDKLQALLAQKQRLLSHNSEFLQQLKENSLRALRKFFLSNLRDIEYRIQLLGCFMTLMGEVHEHSSSFFLAPLQPVHQFFQACIIPQLDEVLRNLMRAREQLSNTVHELRTELVRGYDDNHAKMLCRRYEESANQFINCLNETNKLQNEMIKTCEDFQMHLTDPVVEKLFPYYKGKFLRALEGLERSCEIERVALVLENDSLEKTRAFLGIGTSVLGLGVMIAAGEQVAVRIGAAVVGGGVGLAVGLGLVIYSVIKNKQIHNRRMERRQEALARLRNALSSIESIFNSGFNQSAWDDFKQACVRVSIPSSSSRPIINRDQSECLRQWFDQVAEITRRESLA